MKLKGALKRKSEKLSLKNDESPILISSIKLVKYIKTDRRNNKRGENMTSKLVDIVSPLTYKKNRDLNNSKTPVKKTKTNKNKEKSPNLKTSKIEEKKKEEKKEENNEELKEKEEKIKKAGKNFSINPIAIDPKLKEKEKVTNESK